MGIPTLITETTSTNVASTSFTSGIDSTYDEYMFVVVSYNPATTDVNFTVGFNADGESGYNEVVTNTTFAANHTEDDNTAGLQYHTSQDQAQGTNPSNLHYAVGGGADEHASGILRLYSPSSTTYVTHFTWEGSANAINDNIYHWFTAGYINTTAAITDVQFKSDSGNHDCIIQLYGIS